MKKNLFKILCGALCACLIFSGLVACGGAKWGGTTLKDWGDTDNAEYARAGFVAETEKYLYYINGVPTSTDNNTFGAPIKGALMAVDKTDLTSKTEVVVPKLFAAKNYEQGLFISGNYVYYGTPSTDKTSDGTVASSEMTFMRSKLDGTENTTFFTVDSLSAEYRFVESDGVVYIIYFDTDAAAIKCYNTSTKENKEIAVTDATVQVEEPVNGEHGESLADKYFVGDLVVYTVNVYDTRYIKEQIENSESERSTADYNKVYVYGAGYEEPVLVLDGSEDVVNYKIDAIFDNYVLYTQTKNSVSTTYFVSIDELAEVRLDSEKVNAEYTATDVTKIIDGTTVYVLKDGKVYADSIYKEISNKAIVAASSNISTMLFVRNGELYYVNSGTQLAKIELNNQDAHEVILTENTVVTTWYEPVIITLNQKDYLFYADSSSYGLSYVKYVDLANVKVEDTDDDGEDDKWYIPDEKAAILGNVSDKDLGSIMTAKINAIANELVSGKIAFDTDDNDEIKLTDGKLTWKAVSDVRAEYEALTAGVKANVSETALKALEKYERAIDVANTYYKLNGIEEYENIKDAGEKDTFKQTYKAIYEEIKADVLEFQKADDFAAITGYFDSKLNLLWNFQKAEQLFETAE